MWPSDTPAIRVHSSEPQEQHEPRPNSRSLPSPISSVSSLRSASPVLPMAIPNSRDGVPPPLPPPRHVSEINQGRDLGWIWANRGGPSEQSSPGLTFRQSSVGVGASGGALSPSAIAAAASQQPDPPRPISASPHLHNPFLSHSLPAHSSTQQLPSLSRLNSADDNSASRPNLTRLQSETQLSLRTLSSSAEQFDRQLLSKLGGSSSARTPPSNLSMSLPSPGGSQSGRRSASGLQPLRVPDRHHVGPESPHNRWPGASPSAMSSGSGQAARSPMMDPSLGNSSLSPRHNRSYYPEIGQESHGPYSMPARGSDQNLMIDPELHAEQPIEPAHDDHGSGSRKRRAPSPTPGETDDLYHRRSTRTLNARASPSTRGQLPGSASTRASSLAQSNNSAWGTSMASSATSYVSGGSPSNTISPPGDMDTQRLPRLANLNDPPESNSNMLLNMNAAGLYHCECCLKKPRRFRTLAELKHHEAEKQYQCQYCPNRFKNKNEAERHQNSLHLRKSSWSCAALTSGRQAFHEHSTRPDQLDICGYCGSEFTNPADWRLRNEHLVNEHKFGECNQQKKFFRADHFRQHLKHSHGAASGKWTSQLEAICIKEEQPPAPIRSTMEVTSGRSAAPMGSNDQNSLSPASQSSQVQASHASLPSR